MILQGNDRRLRVGLLGCGAIAQAAHFEACNKARNVDLFAVCDIAADLAHRMAAAHGASRTYTEYDAMLADADIEAIIVATSDPLHVRLSIRALEAGKHVLCEKPIGTSVEEVEELRLVTQRTGHVLQIGHMKRFDPGVESAKAFIDTEMGEMIAFKAWYCDSTARYLVTDAVQPFIVRPRTPRNLDKEVKGDLQRYYMLAHGSHLVDTARYLAGEISEVQARFSSRAGMYCWFVDVAFANGALGHLDLTIAVRMDWHEGFQVYGANGSVLGKTFNPWLFTASHVEIFRERDGTYQRTLGADAHFFRRQLESFAAVILDDGPMKGATIDDGVASVRAMAAIAQSSRTGRPVKLADASGPV